jgi:SAM-dependent methyltransferase
MFKSIARSRIVERVLSRLIVNFYDGQRKAEWESGGEAPHFFSHRQSLVPFIFSNEPTSPYAYARAFFSALAVREEDVVLDIGCGDGFFSRRFLAARASHVDGVDIEEDAIDAARAFNGGANIQYHRLDATKEPFPKEQYDVVAWDGALGHFSASTTELMFAKIKSCLSRRGVFCGSESLGEEGSDHLQFFDSAEDLGRLLGKHFAIVQVHDIEYPLASGFRRREAFWRCAQSDAALSHLRWKSVTFS